MDVDRAIAIVEQILAPKPLNLVQRQIVRSAILGHTYKETTGFSTNDPECLESGRYQLSYVKESAAQLWQSLSQRLERKVTKKSLAAELRWYTKQTTVDVLTHDPQPQNGTPKENIRPTVCDWGAGLEPPSIEIAGSPFTSDNCCFYGRVVELAILTNWCLQERCRMIVLTGMGGMGKSTLAWKLAHRIQDRFDRTIWRSLLNCPPAQSLCKDLLQFLQPDSIDDLPDSLEGKIELLITCLKRDRCLLIFDNVESLLNGQVQTGQYLSVGDDYDRLFKAIGELSHQSCTILTSREQPHTIARLQISNPHLIRSLPVGGLTPDSGHEMIQAYGCAALPAEIWQDVYKHYAGNPLALTIAAVTAVEMTGGGKKVLELYPLIREGKLPFRNIDDILHRQFERLSPLEQQLVYWLAIEREPITSSELRANLVPQSAIGGGILNALQSISRRCVVIRQQKFWTLVPVMITYLDQRSISIIVTELAPNLTTIDGTGEDLQQRFHHLNTYAIVKAQAKDYLRQTLIRTVLRPIIDRLLEIWHNHEALSQHLQQILKQWQSLDPIPPGYLAGNILTLLIELTPDRSLPDLDCAGLPIWSVYLVDVRYNQLNFATATFDRSILT